MGEAIRIKDILPRGLREGAMSGGQGGRNFIGVRFESILLITGSERLFVGANLRRRFGIGNKKEACIQAFRPWARAGRFLGF